MSYLRPLRILSLVLTPLLVIATILTASGPSRVKASSHREAPLISNDPAADNTDVYAFVSPNRNDSVTLIANYIPGELPEGAPNYYNFADEVLYEIHVDNVGDAKAHRTYQFQFKTTIRNPNTFLYNVGPITAGSPPGTYPNLNIRQTYTLREIVRNNGASPITRTLATNLPVPPANVGRKSIPDYIPLHSAGVRSIGSGASEIKVFAGPRDDPFWVDLGSIFDLLTLRPNPAPVGYQNGPSHGVDALAGFNVHTIAIQLPIARLTLPGEPVIGVWATASRPSTTILNGDGSVSYGSKRVQVSRLGMPLVNEVVLPLGLKNAFNSLKPQQDFDLYTSGTPAGNLFKKSVLDPELQNLLQGLYGVPHPSGDRLDIQEIFLTGIKTDQPFTLHTPNGSVVVPAGTNVNQPANVRPADMLRLNTAPAFRPGHANSLCKPVPDYKLGLLGGDACGFPNGRRLKDDIVEIELLAVAGAAAGVVANMPFTFNRELIGVLDDGVYYNDRSFIQHFPYIPRPHSGSHHVHESSATSQGAPVTQDHEHEPEESE